MQVVTGGGLEITQPPGVAVNENFDDGTACLTYRPFKLGLARWRHVHGRVATLLDHRTGCTLRPRLADQGAEVHKR